MRTLLLGAMVALLAPCAMAQVYGATDEEGNVVLSNHDLEGTSVIVVEAPPLPEVVAPAATPRAAAATIDQPPEQAVLITPKQLVPIIRDAARKHSVSEALLTAVVAVESGFDQRAVSTAGAKGLMQLMPATARRFGVKDAFAAEQNVHGGAAYLRVLMNQFPEDLRLALAAYNAGEGAVLRAGRRIPAFAETQTYVRKVLARLALGSDPSATLRP